MKMINLTKNEIDNLIEISDNLIFCTDDFTIYLGLTALNKY